MKLTVFLRTLCWCCECKQWTMFQCTNSYIFFQISDALLQCKPAYLPKKPSKPYILTNSFKTVVISNYNQICSPKWVRTDNAIHILRSNRREQLQRISIQITAYCNTISTERPCYYLFLHHIALYYWMYQTRILHLALNRTPHNYNDNNCPTRYTYTHTRYTTNIATKVNSVNSSSNPNLTAATKTPPSITTPTL
jgi:hypothetical protein